MAPEIKVLFPSVKRIGISRTVIASTTDAPSDTLTVAMVEGRLSHAERRKLAEYLTARLATKVEIVDMR